MLERILFLFTYAKIEYVSVHPFRNRINTLRIIRIDGHCSGVTLLNSLGGSSSLQWGTARGEVYVPATCLLQGKKTAVVEKTTDSVDQLIDSSLQLNPVRVFRSTHVARSTWKRPVPSTSAGCCRQPWRHDLVEPTG